MKNLPHKFWRRYLGKADDPLVFGGVVIATAGVPDKYGRVLPFGILLKAAAEHSTGSEVYGDCRHLGTNTHYATNFRMKNHHLLADIHLQPHPHQQQLAELLRQSGQARFLILGGNSGWKFDGKNYIAQDGFSLSRIDII